ncbi:hypothetical protein E2C01_042084 [Portunus trituberculatus]|uniref:Uncharacterized protein n=1 Tax=Portunus trituberculatus TaxID=210409 RepID=A0A5B7FS32_PORTR|nr:hypothetical protein [Portunus trituberculatus]
MRRRVRVYVRAESVCGLAPPSLGCRAVAAPERPLRVNWEETISPARRRPAARSGTPTTADFNAAEASPAVPHVPHKQLSRKLTCEAWIRGGGLVPGGRRGAGVVHIRRAVGGGRGRGRIGHVLHPRGLHGGWGTPVATRVEKVEAAVVEQVESTTLLLQGREDVGYGEGRGVAGAEGHQVAARRGRCRPYQVLRVALQVVRRLQVGVRGVAEGLARRGLEGGGRRAECRGESQCEGAGEGHRTHRPINARLCLPIAKGRYRVAPPRPDAPIGPGPPRSRPPLSCGAHAPPTKPQEVSSIFTVNDQPLFYSNPMWAEPTVTFFIHELFR